MRFQDRLGKVWGPFWNDFGVLGSGQSKMKAWSDECAESAKPYGFNAFQASAETLTGRKSFYDRGNIDLSLPPAFKTRL